MNYLTDAEIEAINAQSLSTGKPSRETPWLIQCVSGSMFSVARHYGGMDYQGQRYIYIPPTDELVRNDVFKWAAKRRKAEAALNSAADIDRQMGIEP